MYSKADMHIHTTYSDGLMTPEETVDAIATQTDLRVIAITDHDTAEGAFVARAYARRCAPHLKVIIGQEVSTGDGEVMGLFLKHSLPAFETAAKAIEAIHAQGGLAVAVHPFSQLFTFNAMRGVGQRIFDLPFDAIEVRNGVPVNVFSNLLTAWLNRHVGQRLSELGGSDSHLPVTAGQALTWFPGNSVADLRRAVESGTVRAGSTLWTLPSIVRSIPTLLRHGLPHDEHARPDQNGTRKFANPCQGVA